ncbi:MULTISPECIES: hypothetical protein [unclassified Streptomyces]|uniref:hypothetical protein n=1 Tax=unclassified Streptomyces TaxID=2593676 RepID=UPI0035D8335D
MIRAGRAQQVRTIADLAREAGVSLSKYQKDKPYLEEGFPQPISSKDARARLFDADQVAAHRTGRPVPPLPAEDDDQDLLDRREAADLIGVAIASWDVYKKRPEVARHRVVFGGVEHWPRSVILAFRSARDSRPATGGRPKGTGDMIPREQLLERTALLLDADPTLSAAGVTEALGVHTATAQRALTQLRARRIADRLEQAPGLTPGQAAAELGYPAAHTRAALNQAGTELRARAAGTYLAQITEALHQAGLTTTADPPIVQQNDDTLRAALPLAETAPAAALVWEEQTGWRTASRRRHPFTAPDTRPLLAGTAQPAPSDLLAALGPEQEAKEESA